MIQSNAAINDDSLPIIRARSGSVATSSHLDRVKGESELLKAGVQSCIGSELEQVEWLIRSATTSQYDEITELCKSAAAMGGKRLRPTLVWLAAYAQAGEQLKRQHDSRMVSDLTSIAAAVELVHAASLVHDDVMDSATQRRHQPTIVGQVGNSAAVLLGDLLFTRAYALAASCQKTYPARHIATAATRLCEGELRQQVSAGQWLLTPAKYRSMLLQKTGALCAVSCRLGVWRVGGNAMRVRALGHFGKLLGLAFQIHDDWLDYWGTEQVGKTLGTDLAQSKPTLPIIQLLQNTPEDRKAALISLLDDPGEGSRQAIRKLLDASDAEETTLRVARAYSERAKLELKCFPASAAKDCLIAVADYSVRRAM